MGAQRWQPRQWPGARPSAAAVGSSLAATAGVRATRSAVRSGSVATGSSRTRPGGCSTSGPVPTGVDSWSLPVDGATLRGYAGGAGRTVVLVHGWSGSAADWRHLAGDLIPAGWRVVVPDLPAHGMTAGRQTDLFVLGRALAAVLGGGSAPRAWSPIRWASPPPCWRSRTAFQYTARSWRSPPAARWCAPSTGSSSARASRRVWSTSSGELDGVPPMLRRLLADEAGIDVAALTGEARRLLDRSASLRPPARRPPLSALRDAVRMCVRAA